jgi:hypothetical protein
MATLRTSLAQTVDEPGQYRIADGQRCPFETEPLSGKLKVERLQRAGRCDWLEAFIARCRIEVHIEGIARQADRDRIIHR